MTFANAVAYHNNSQGVTTNGARTNLSSMSACVDLFFAAGASRGKDISDLFKRAYTENREIAVRLLLWLRDCRGGAGEREQFRKLWQTLHLLNPVDANIIIDKVPELGRWDDLLAAQGDNRTFALAMIEAALKDGNRLAAKWMPRKGPEANELRKFLGLTPKAYRKLLVDLSDTVEQRMCAKEWDAINFNHVPSVAAARYQKAFGRNAADAYAAYKASLVKGTAKVNASAIFPYDVLRGLKNGDVTVATAQWNALPNFLGDDFILPMVDVSGSMDCPVGGDYKSTTTCMDVAISLGLYLADKQSGAFRDLVLTFSGSPEFVRLHGKTLAQKEHAIRTSQWAMNTNIEAAFQAILDVAVANRVPADQMPKKLLILSDMEFDAATREKQSWRYGYRPQPKTTALSMAKEAYAAAGYDLPQIVFWNLNARAGNSPATIRDDGTALVSGFSPAILKAILKGKTITPASVMMDALMVERYDLNPAPAGLLQAAD